MSTNPNSIAGRYVKEIEDIKSLYLSDPRPLSVGYSGGKDSSVALDLVIKALLQVENPTKPVYVLFSDTQLEMDPVIKDIDRSLDRLEEYAKAKNLPIVIKRATPAAKESFFYLLIGKGYSLPSQNNRWCTDRLKIRPQKKIIDDLLGKHDGFISITGQRAAESPDRKNRLKVNTIDGHLKKHDNSKCSMYTPIENMSADEVWTYLYTLAEPWIDVSSLGKTYADAAADGGECRTLLEGIEGEQAGCSKSARFGCWACMLFKEDKTLVNFGKQYAYLQEMERFRNWLQSFQLGSWETRDYYMHGRYQTKAYDFDNHRKNMKIPGGFSLHFRAQILMELMEAEKKVLPLRGAHLISDEELGYIQEQWIEEGDTEYLAGKICKHRNVTISAKHSNILEALTVYKNAFFNEKSFAWEAPNSFFIPRQYSKTIEHLDSRFFAQLSKNFEDHGLMSADIARNAVKGDEEAKLAYNVLISKVKPKVFKHTFYSYFKESCIREEWNRDYVLFTTFEKMLEKGEIDKPNQNLFGYDGPYSRHFEMMDELKEKGDITLCDSIPLKDKMAAFERDF